MSRGLLANGPQIRRLRKASGLSQEALAIAVGCDVKTIHHAERGQRVHAETLVKLADTLRVDLSTIQIASSDTDVLLEIRLRQIRHWRQAFADQNIDALIEIYHLDAQATYPGLGLLTQGGTAIGKAAIRLEAEGIFKLLQFDPWPETASRIHASSNFVFLRGELTGSVRDSGKKFVTQAIHEFEFRDQQIHHHTGMYDTSTLLSQLM